VQLCERLCDPCVCVLGVWCAFRGVDRWDLAVLACLDTRKDLAESAIARPPSLLVEEKKEENKFVVHLSPMSSKSLSPQTPRGASLLDVDAAQL
jgi:hypothetical protein